MPDDEIEIEENDNSSLLSGAFDEDPQRSELDKIFEQIFDPKNLEYNTEMTRDEITAFSTLGVVAKKYGIDVLKEWLIENKKLRVSLARKGRGEFVKITSRNPNQDFNPQRSRWNFFRRDMP